MNLDIEIKRFSPKPGDLLFVRVKKELGHETVVHMSDQIRAVLAELKVPRLRFIVVDEDVNIEHLNEKDMERIGWIKKK